MDDEFKSFQSVFWVRVLVTQNLSKTLDGSHDAFSLVAIPAGLVFGDIERDVDEMPGFRLRTCRSNIVGPRRDLVQMLGMAVVQREQLRNLGLGSVSEPGFSNFGDDGVSFRPPRLCVSTAHNRACEYGSNGNFRARHKTPPKVARMIGEIPRMQQRSHAIGAVERVGGNLLLRR